MKELTDAIAAGEGPTIEFKQTIPTPPRKLAREMAAMANGEEGTIFIGVRNDGSIAGLENPDQVDQTAANLARDAVNPSMRPIIEQFTLKGLSLVRIQVQQQFLPRQVQGKHYIRVGSTVREAASEEIASLYTSRAQLSDFLLSLDSKFAGFFPENIPPAYTRDSIPSIPAAEWQVLEDLRIKHYQENHGLFLVHIWKPSVHPGQVADIAIALAQHRKGPLSRGEVQSVEYQLGQRFFAERVIKTDSANNFLLEVSAYAPMLCLAKVSFSGRFEAIHLSRYIDFDV